MDMKSTGGQSLMKDAGGRGLMSKTRNWDEGAPADFKGRIHPSKGVVTQQKSAAMVRQPKGGSAPPAAALGSSDWKTAANVQSAKAPRHPMPPAVGRIATPKGGDKYAQRGRTKGPDKGPKTTGKSGGSGVT